MLQRNGKNRTPGGQLKLPEATRALLQEAEAARRQQQAEQQRMLYDGPMRATQTASAVGVRVT